VYSANELDKHVNSLDLDFDWQLSRWKVEIEAMHRYGTGRFILGAGLARTSAKTGYTLSEDGFSQASLYSELQHQPRRKMSQTLAFHLMSNGTDLRVKAAVAQRLRIGERHIVEAVLSYLDRLPEEDDRIWYWVQRGYAFLSDNGVDVTYAGRLSRAHTAAFDARWMNRISTGLSLRVGAYLRSLSGLSLEDQRFQFNPLSQSFSGPVQLVPSRRGKVVGAEITASWEALRAFELDLSYRYQGAASGDGLFKRTWRAFPRHRLRITARHTPWESVGLWGMLQYRSATRWADYRDADAQTDGAYSQVVDDALTLDLAVQKWLWDRRTRLHLLFRSVFDDAVPYHPIGAAYGLTFIVQGEVSLD
jgi:hypothetical protein